MNSLAFLFFLVSTTESRNKPRMRRSMVGILDQSHDFERLRISSIYRYMYIFIKIHYNFRVKHLLLYYLSSVLLVILWDVSNTLSGLYAKHSLCMTVTVLSPAELFVLPLLGNL